MLCPLPQHPTPTPKNTFLDVSYPYYCCCRYESDADMAERFYYGVLGGCGPAPRSAGPDVVRAVLQQHVNCPAMLAIVPMQVRR